MSKEVEIYRKDFRHVESEDVDFFSDLVVELGLAKNYTEAESIETVIIKVESSSIGDVFDLSDD